MLRSERLEPVLGIASTNEQCAVAALVSGEARVKEAESKLEELQRYSREYRENLHDRTKNGIEAPQLRTFHAFISRLGDAIAQQVVAVGRAREDRDSLRQRWLEASRRTQAVGKVIEHASDEERRAAERRDQHDNDERAQRTFAAAVLARRDSPPQTQQCEES